MNIKYFLLIFSSLACIGVSYAAEEIVQTPAEQESLLWGFSSRQGKRSAMEDAFIYKQIQLTPYSDPVTYFGLFDGRGGDQAAKYAARYAPIYFASSYKDNLLPIPDINLRMKASLIESYILLDKDIQEQYTNDGTTALSVVLDGNDAYIAWAGDSRALVLDESGGTKYVTTRHTLKEETELEWITKAGLQVGAKLMDPLPVTRILGDKFAKSKVPSASIIPTPDVKQLVLQKGDIVILASSGLWNALGYNYVASFVADQMVKSVELLQKERSTDRALSNEKAEEACLQKLLSGDTNGCDDNKLTLIARALRDKAYERGSKDNISVLVFQPIYVLK